MSVCQRSLREVGLTSVEQLKASITKLSCSIQKLHDSISREDRQPHSLVSSSCVVLLTGEFIMGGLVDWSVHRGSGQFIVGGVLDWSVHRGWPCWLVSSSWVWSVHHG